VELLGKENVDWWVVDHYAIDSRWEKIVRATCKKLMVIDDLADRTHDCELLVDQNLAHSPRDYADLVPGNCTILCGPHNSLLRPEFSELRNYSLRRRANSSLQHLLISVGGMDKSNATGKILNALGSCKLRDDSRITVVMGRHGPWLNRVTQEAACLPWHTEVFEYVPEMAQLMANSDLAIGGVGTTAWERCCLGLPSIGVILADNQRKSALALQKRGALCVTGDIGSVTEHLPAALLDFSDPRYLRSVSTACASITDGRGSNLLIEAMLREIHL
jgi:UDP-2,4-diacetamido-2,4,6-trideoxy-beta-L-altropyranose hydrolase